MGEHVTNLKPTPPDCHREEGRAAVSFIDYDALSALMPGLEVIHENGALIYSYDLAGTRVEAEDHDGTAVVYLRRWDLPGVFSGEDELGRFPAYAGADIAGCMRLAIEEAGQ